MTTPTIITANYGGYDFAKLPPPDCIGNAVMFTDLAQVTGWTIRNEASAQLPPRYRSKGAKACPHLYGIENNDVLWIDGSMQTTGKNITSLFELVKPGGIGVFRHRWRDCIRDEAAASVAMPCYRGEKITEQAQHYLQKHPAHWGLWENGIIVWRGAQHRMGPRWLAEMMAWSSQDQISFPYVIRELSIDVTDLPGTVVNNDWFYYTHHQHYGT